MGQYKVVNGKKEPINEQGMTEQEFIEWYKKEEKDKYEKPSVTTDMLIFTVSDKQQRNNRKLAEKELKVLLIKRKDHPFIGKWAIPGGFASMNEDLHVTAERELKEETNVDNVYMEQLYTWGDVDRDPRMRVISTSYMALVDSSNLNIQAGDDAVEAKWFSVQRNVIGTEKTVSEQGVTIVKNVELQLVGDDGEDNMLYNIVEETKMVGAIVKTETQEVLSANNTDNLAFDHAKILNYGLERLQNKLEYTAIAFNLMPKHFSITELQMVYETILGRELLKANFRRKIMPMVIETEKVKEHSAHRPSKLYRFNPEWGFESF